MSRSRAHALRRAIALALPVVSGAAPAADAPSGQAYPVKPVRLVIAFAAGGPGDTAGRLITPRLGELWGQQVIVDNRGGANSIVGTEIVSRAPADGYTLLIVSAGFAINASLYAKLPYDTLRDFTPITPITFGPSVLVVHPSLPVRSLKELVALAKAKPGALAYASSGSGAPGSHLGMELIKANAGIDIVHVPYKSMAPGLVDILGGQVPMGIPTVNVSLPHIRAGRLRAIGVTSTQRLSVAPDIPTIAEQGMPGYEANNWYGIMAPAGVPAAIVEKIHADVTKAVMSPDAQGRTATLGMEGRTMPPAEFAAYVRSEIAKWAKVVKASGARAE
jgi:tripartite-type tricarboxylate transporter receptor subunit TctC